MLTITAGESATIAVPFERDGEPFLADANSVDWILRGQDGAVLGEPVSITPDDTYALVVVDAGYNTVASGKRFEKRFVVVRGTVDDQPFTAQVPYRVAPFLNTTATAEAVRKFTGADASELPDTDIDLVEAYFLIADAVGPEALEEALASGTVNEQVANQAIVAQSVLTILPGLRQRLLKSNSDGTMTAQRFDVDFDRLERDAYSLVEGALRTLGSDPAVERTLFMVSQPVDLITGA